MRPEHRILVRARLALRAEFVLAPGSDHTSPATAYITAAGSYRVSVSNRHFGRVPYPAALTQPACRASNCAASREEPSRRSWPGLGWSAARRSPISYALFSPSSGSRCWHDDANDLVPKGQCRVDGLARYALNDLLEFLGVCLPTASTVSRREPALRSTGWSDSRTTITSTPVPPTARCGDMGRSWSHRADDPCIRRKRGVHAVGVPSRTFDMPATYLRKSCGNCHPGHWPSSETEYVPWTSGTSSAHCRISSQLIGSGVLTAGGGAVWPTARKVGEDLCPDLEAAVE